MFAILESGITTIVAVFIRAVSKVSKKTSGEFWPAPLKIGCICYIHMT